jgi:murein DD-endopeptidase MepM/ murein hydrolase activator NlpD
LKEVLEYNDITLGTPLHIGDTIIIPDAEMTVSEITVARKPSSIKDSTLNVPLGYYIRPIVGGRKSQGIHGHNGVDLAAPAGTIIRASAGGKVISSISNGSWNGGYGNYIIISHDNGTQTLYAHIQKSFVSVGDVVEQGEMIAKIGMTGRTTGPHVHFEIRSKGNTYKNPF